MMHLWDCCNKQFKKERIDKKVRSIVAKANDNPAPNQYQIRVGQTLTPLIAGKIQYHKMKRIHNMQQIRLELVARGLGDKFTDDTLWTALLKILKADEKDNTYFTPLIKYNLFKWNITHFDAGELQTGTV